MAESPTDNFSNPNNLSSQVRKFYNGRETSPDEWEDIPHSNIHVSQTSHQRNRGRFNKPNPSNSFRNKRGRGRGGRGKNYKTRILKHNSFQTDTTDVDSESDNRSEFNLNAGQANPNFNYSEEKNKCREKLYGVEFLPNSVNTVDKNPSSYATEKPAIYTESSSRPSDGEDDSDDPIEDKVAIFLKTRAQYMNVAETIKPTEIRMRYRKKIFDMTETVVQSNMDKIEKLTKKSSSPSIPVLELHIKNLKLQHSEFEKFVNDSKDNINAINFENNEDLLKKIEKIELQVQNECHLFESTLPAYGYKSRILNSVNENQVVIISSDCSYFFNIVTPIIIQEALPTHSIIFCESNNLASEYVKVKIGNILGKGQEIFPKVKYVTDNQLLCILSGNGKAFDKFVAIINVPLKRSVDLDLSIAFLRDLLFKQENSKLILLASIFDNTENYKRYFSNIKSTCFDVPKLLLPIKTMWKKDPSKNFKEDLVSTVLALHILERPGNVIAFLPNESEIKIALAMFNRKIQDLNLENFDGREIRGASLNKNSDVSCLISKLSPGKRIIFFTTHSSEVVPMPSVRYIIDCGLKRDYIYSKEKNLDILTTEFCSRAKAKQRKSLVRVFTNGICYRIYNKENFCKNMPSFELPDFLTQNPFNSLIKIYQHAPKNALSVELVQELDSAVKYHNIKQLNKFRAIKNEKLTVLGESIIKLPFPVKYSKMILTAIQWGCAYEAVVLVAYFSIDSFLFQYSQDEEKQLVIDAAKLELLQHDSDALSFLNIFKLWIKNEASKTWCDKFYINWNTLNEIQKKVSEICQSVEQCINENILQEFKENDELISDLRNILLESFADQFCVFSGHYKSGYRILSSSHSAFIHPSSMLCNKENLYQFIVFNKIVDSSRSFLIGITAFPQELIQKSITSPYEKTLDYDFSDIFERTLVSKSIQPVGERIIKQVLLGKKGKKLQEIEDSIKKALKTNSLVIEPCVEKGCVNIYALEPYLKAAVDKVDQILKSNVDDIINAEQVHTLDLKRGEVVVHVEVRCIMGAKVVSVEVRDNYIDSTLNQRNSGSERNSSFNSNSFVQCSLNLTWVRRPCNGNCYIQYASDDFEKARKLSTRNFSILGSEVYFQVCRNKECTLLCSEVPSEARINDIEEALGRFLPNIKGAIKMIFDPPFESSLNDAKNIEIEIQDIIEEYTRLSDYEIKVPKPKDAATIWTAYVNVFCTENLTATAEKLSNVLIDEYKIDAKPVYRSIINISYKLFKVLESTLEKDIKELKEKLREKFPNKEDLFYFTVETNENLLDGDLVRMKLLSNDIAIMKQLQRAVNELLEGEILNKSIISDIHKLFCHGGHLWLRTLGRSKNVHIIEEYNSKTIRLYGEKIKCNKVKKCIINFLEDTESEAVETIVLGTNKNKRTMLKAVIKKYGVDLNRLIEQVPKLRSASLDIKSNQLVLHGNRQSIDKVKEILDELSSTLDSSGEIALLGGGEMCPVCATPAFNLAFRLQHCNHLYCNECIVSLVTQAKIPLQCCAENCSEDIVLDDIVRILDDDDKKMKQLLQASLDDYLEQNVTDIIYCPAPDCSMFFNKNEVVARHKCPLCLNEICTRCNVVFHYGYTCDVFQGSTKDPDYSYKVWKQTTKECKECPKCKTAIERIAGCDHMTCALCKAHFCWVCVREFPKANDVYNHIPFCDMHPKW